MITFGPVTQDVTAQEVLREFQKPLVGYYVSAPPAPCRLHLDVVVAGSVTKNGTEPSKPHDESKKPLSWTAVSTSTSGTSVHGMAWTEEVPMVPWKFESDHLALGLNLTARTVAWPR